MKKKSNIFQRLFSFISYKEKPTVKEFYIPEVDENQHEDNNGNNENSASKEGQENNKGIKKPIPVSEFKKETATKQKKANDKTISTNIKLNMDYIKAMFNAPTNKDIIIRELVIAEQYNAFIAYLDGMIDKNVINNFILRPLLNDEKLKGNEEGCSLDYIFTNVLETNQLKKVKIPNEAIFEILTGNTLLYVDGCDFYISNETKGFPARGVEKPQIEGVVTGAQEAFNESIRTNISLIRKIIKNNNLTTEFIEVGKRNQNLCAILYLNDVVNPAIVDEVKRRISSLDVDFIMGDGILEQFIEDNTYSIFPTMLTTERPDKAAAHIVEGRVGIVIEGTPFIKIVPITIAALIHSPEDSFMRWPFGTLLRIVRLLGIFFAALLPGMYVAITNFHQEMIPTDLLIAIAKAKENVPFPAILEVLLMEVSFELIREAGIRIPGIIGNTLGIIGALILGQAAVQANIVSPILIIVVAITGLGNFAVPNFSVALSIRLVRFGFIIIGALMGFYGITALFMLLAIYLVDLKSFGVSFLAPIAPRTGKSKDLFVRSPVWKQELRPDMLNPLDIRRQPKISRKWRQENHNYGYDKEGDND